MNDLSRIGGPSRESFWTNSLTSERPRCRQFHWDNEIQNNPLAVCFTGLKRVLREEDRLTLLPFVLIGILEAACFLYFGNGGSRRRFVFYLTVISCFSPFILAATAQWSAIRYFQSIHAAVDLSQLTLTRLSNSEFLHGIVIRPLSLNIRANWMLVLASGLELLAILAVTRRQVDFFPLVAILFMRYFCGECLIRNSIAIAARYWCFVSPHQGAARLLFVEYLKTIGQMALLVGVPTLLAVLPPPNHLLRSIGELISLITIAVCSVALPVILYRGSLRAYRDIEANSDLWWFRNDGETMFGTPSILLKWRPLKTALHRQPVPCVPGPASQNSPGTSSEAQDSPGSSKDD